MPARLRVLAGDCQVTERGDRTHTHRGHVVVIVKPD
jgi:DNA topoisomerase-1